VLPRLSYIRFITTIGTRANITDEPTVVATTVAITVATTLATTVAISRVWTAISISPDLTVSKLLKSETYRYPDDADCLRKLVIEAGLPE
jgi:hypothetical protein